jgi:small subunit ribosomal protein S12e
LKNTRGPCLTLGECLGRHTAEGIIYFFDQYNKYKLYLCRDAPEVVAEAPVAAPAEPLDINQAIQIVLKKALAHDGLARGLHEAARAIEKGQAQLCILADDCNQPDYVKLIQALCTEHNVNLISVPENKLLGQWAGLCKIDPAGEARKVVACSVAVVTDYGEETAGLAMVNEYIKVSESHGDGSPMHKKGES